MGGHKFEVVLQLSKGYRVTKGIQGFRLEVLYHTEYCPEGRWIRCETVTNHMIKLFMDRIKI